MKKRWVFALIFLLVATAEAYWLGVPGVPFHPDETSYLYMSGDVELLMRDPAAVFWQENPTDPIRQNYRLLNSPLLHDLLGLSRLIIGKAPLPVDWDWGKTWAENQTAGAMPSAEMLLAGRMAMAVFFPFTLLFFFLAVRRAANGFTAWVALLLLASNALVWLHTRRAMAEGPLLFTAALTLWSLMKSEQRPWLTGFPAALAFSAKQTLGALMPVAFLAVLWTAVSQPEPNPANRLRQALRQLLLFGTSAVVVIALLHPILWSDPIRAVQAAANARQTLAAAQSQDRPAQGLDTPGKKIAAMVGSLYLTPLIFSETANYVDDTRCAEAAYLAHPLHNLLRTPAGGGALLFIGLCGFLLAGLRAYKARGLAQRRIVLLMAATLIQALGLLWFIPLPWQRYYMPLVPYTCLWAAYGVDGLREIIARALLARRAALPASPLLGD